MPQQAEINKLKIDQAQGPYRGCFCCRSFRFTGGMDKAQQANVAWKSR
ncbi:hypothetical protein O9992_14185 [Vibrio lentus]|nr:hypothetical protein [Vibrio lentus]